MGTRERVLASESNPFKRIWLLIGPGFVTGAADDDPTAIATYSIAGAAYGYGLLWTALFTYPLLAAVQWMSDKLGLVTGRGLAGVLRDRLPRPLLWMVIGALLVANAVNVGADLAAIASGVHLLVSVPVGVLIVPIAVAIMALLLLGSYRAVETVFRLLMLVMLSYLGAAVLTRPDWAMALYDTFLPPLSGSAPYLATLVAILGGNISPYLLFWQASHEMEEQRGERSLPGEHSPPGSGVSPGRPEESEHAAGDPQDGGRPAERTEARERAMRRDRDRSGERSPPGKHSHPPPGSREFSLAAWDIGLGMLLSNAIVYFIEVAAAGTLFRTGHVHLRTAADAAIALRPLAGPGASGLFAAGIIASGLIAIPTLTGASAYAVAEAWGERASLDVRHPLQAKVFYAVILASTLIGVGLNYVGIEPMGALFWSATLNGFVSPPLLVLLLWVANDRRVLGDRVNGWFVNVLGGLAAALMVAAAVALVLSWA